tara:strand:- start:234 stop:728 length:495 start_codon:yes stop_codon:yes gene_type:complete
MDHPESTANKPCGQDSEELDDFEVLDRKYRRLQADMDNYRKRVDRMMAESIKRRKRDLLSSILPVVDNLELAIESTNGDKPELTALLDGVKLTKDQLLAALDANGVRRINASGKFDPRFHEAVDSVQSDSIEDGHIVEELRAGYLLDDVVLRPSVVKVATSDES